MAKDCNFENGFYDLIKGEPVEIEFTVGDNLTGILAWVDIATIGVDLFLGGPQVMLYKHSIKRIERRRDRSRY